MALFGSDTLFNLTDEEEILKTLAGRQHWNKVRPEVLRTLIRNAGKDVLKISRFVFISEYHDCVKNNYVELSRIWEDPRLALSAFAATLVGLAGDIIQHLGDLPDGSERQSQAIGMVEISFLSALLCDPYMLSAYKGLARFYQGTGKGKLAAAMCRKFDDMEKAILSGTDEYTRSYCETRYKPIAAGMRAEMDRLKSQIENAG